MTGNKQYDAVIIGGGPAGMMAAVTMAEKGLKAIIAEKNKILGRKLRITGKGRCNVTNACDFETLTENIIAGNKFLLSSLRKFSNSDLIDYLNSSGLETVTERGARVFPASGRAYDVAELFVRRLKELRVPVLYDFTATKLLLDDSSVKLCGVEGILSGKKHVLYSDTVVIATGGITYQGTGSDGTGFSLAIRAGHSVVPPLPSLIALKCAEKGDCGSMQGLTLKNTGIRLYEANKPVFEDFGELMFTENGITGPTVLSLSRYYIEKAIAHRDPVREPDELKPYLRFDRSIYDPLNSDRRFYIELDLKPALDDAALDKRIAGDLLKYKSKLIKNALCDLLPGAIIEPVLSRAGIGLFRQVSSISKVERNMLVKALKHFRLTPLGPDDPDHGVITQGGITLKEIDPATLSSKLLKGLYFAGEIIDADGLTGGFNLTIAFSTGRSAGLAIANSKISDPQTLKQLN